LHNISDNSKIFCKCWFNDSFFRSTFDRAFRLTYACLFP